MASIAVLIMGICIAVAAAVYFAFYLAFIPLAIFRKIKRNTISVFHKTETT